MPDSAYRPIVDGMLALAIGNLVTEWAGVQTFLTKAVAEMMIGKSMDEDDDHTHITAIIGMEPRVLMGLFKTLAPLRIGPQRAERMSKILDKMEKAKELRDLLSHCIWKRDDKGRMIAVRLKTIGKIKLYERHITFDQIMEKIRDLHDGAIRHGLLRCPRLVHI
jgi:hypothetical protein